MCRYLVCTLLEFYREMGSVDDKGCYSPRTNSYNLELSKANHTTKKVSNGRKALNSRSKPTPSKWDDAQKWLVGLSGVGDNNHHSKAKPRNSNAEDRRLLAPMPQKGRDSCSSIDGGLEEDLALSIPIPNQEEGETKKIDCSDQSVWRTNRPVEEAIIGVRSVSLRDMGTEMTPVASKEPSRTGTPLRARSPINSRASSPGRSRLGVQHVECNQTDVKNTERKNRVDGDQSCSSNIVESNGNGFVRKSSSLGSRAMAWDEAERTKYMAR